MRATALSLVAALSLVTLSLVPALSLVTLSLVAALSLVALSLVAARQGRPPRRIFGTRPSR